MADDNDGIFGPPDNPSVGLTYGWGNLVYEYSSNGVWNILSGSLIGERGPQGLPGPAGTAGDAGTAGITGPGYTGATLLANGTLEITFGEYTSNTTFVQTLVNLGRVRGHTGPGYTGATITTTGDFSLTFADWSTGNLVSTRMHIGTIRGITGTTGPVGATAPQVVFAIRDGGGVLGASGNYNFQFNGTTAHFGGANTRFTITGPTMQIGYNTVVEDGVFKSPRELSGYRTVSSTSTLNISPSHGTIQRIYFTPDTGTVTINADSSGWSNITGHSETIVCFIKTNSDQVNTGKFADNIVCTSPRPNDICNHGVTGVVDMITLMRICTGTGKGLTMGFYVSRGLTNSTGPDRSTNFETI